MRSSYEDGYDYDGCDWGELVMRGLACGKLNEHDYDEMIAWGARW